MLFTRHDDCPGVVGALGGILGRENINISRMQVGRRDLTELFVDLPEPHPSLEPARGTAASRRPASRAVSQPGWRSRVARILVSLAPFIALAAFFRTDSWLVFLLIPMIVVLARAIDD